MAETVLRPLDALPANPILSLSELNDIEGDLLALPASTFRIALLIPMCGSAGIWAPSCISSAQLAVAELNDASGILGRQVELGVYFAWRIVFF